MTNEAKQFVEDNIKLAYKFFYEHNIMDEDIKQTLLLRLCMAADSYDPEMGKPSTYIYTVLHNELCHINRAKNQTKRRGDKITLNLNYTYNDEEKLTLEDMIETKKDYGDSINDVEVNISIEQLLNKCKKSTVSNSLIKRHLSERELDIFYRRLNNETVNSIAKSYNISAQRISEITRDIAKQIKKEVYSWYE